MSAALRRLPLALTLLRAGLAPVVVALALAWPNGVAFGACLVVAFLSDVFDGIVARRLGVATATLRRLGGCRALGLERAGASCGARQGADEAWDGPPQRVGNAEWPRKSPRPLGLGLQGG